MPTTTCECVHLARGHRPNDVNHPHSRTRARERPSANDGARPSASRASMSAANELSQRIVGVSHDDVEGGASVAPSGSTSDGVLRASTITDNGANERRTAKRQRAHSHNYSGPTPRAVKAFLVASVVTLLALITTAATSGKIEALRESLSQYGAEEGNSGGRVVMDGSAPRRDCGVTQEAWNKATGLDRHDPCRDVSARGSGSIKDAYDAIKGDGENSWALVTGGAGFIGSEVVRQLLDIGMRVRVLDDLSTGSPAKLAFAQAAQKEGRYAFVKGDVRKYEDVSRAMNGVDFVFHLAAVSKVKPTLDFGREDVVLACVESNVRGTENVLRATRARDSGGDRRARFVYVGSSTYYGNQPTPFDEERTHLRTTTSPYATTKAQGEDLARLYYSLYGVEAVVTRLFMVYGPGEPAEAEQAVVTGRFFAAASKGDALEIEGDGSQFRDFIHVSDAARGIVLAAFAEGAPGRTFNIGSGKSTTILDLAKMISKKHTFVDAREPDLKGTLASTCAAKRVLGFEAKMSLTDYIRKTKRERSA